MSLRLASVVGARPEFIQVGAITRNIERGAVAGVEHHLVNTGQHYDFAMSTAFFAEGMLPTPSHHLEIGSKPPSIQVGEMLTALAPVLDELQPDVVIVYGDTNSTLAGALAAAKEDIPVAHVEAGLRSFNLAMPEELNRRLTDHLARYRFCPSGTAVANLAMEGITTGVELTGDVNYESLMHTMPSTQEMDQALQRHGVETGRFAMATSHRAENTNDPERLRQILLGLGDVAEDHVPVLFPVHPRTRGRIDPHVVHSGVRLLEPVPHHEMIALVASAALLLTDSGGLQKEAYWLSTPCVTMRDDTEWVETVQTGWNRLTGADRRSIAAAAREATEQQTDYRPPLYGEGASASQAILTHLVSEAAEALIEAS